MWHEIRVKAMRYLRSVNFLGTVYLVAALCFLGFAIIPESHVNPWVALAAAILAAHFGASFIGRRKDDTLVEMALVRGDVEAARQAASRFFGLKSFLGATNISGMPFATIAMTITFCFLAFLSHVVNAVAASKGASAEIIPKEFPAAVLELAKLTLGAFIGSFVSRPVNLAEVAAASRTAESASSDGNSVSTSS